MAKKETALIKRKEPKDDGQLDLFFIDVADVSLKDAQHSMAVPFLSLSKRPRFEPLEYRNPKTGEHLLVTGPKPFGIATIWDFDIMIWLFGQVVREVNRGNKPSRHLAFHAYDCLQGIQRGTSGTDYDRFEAALRRLQSTTIHTNIDNEAPMSESVGWLDEVHIQRGKNGRAEHIELSLSRWIYAKATDQKRILTLHKNYFLLTSGVAKQLYRIARKMAGHRSFRVSMQELAKRAGAEDYENFCDQVRAVSALNDDHEQAFPEYRVLIERQGKGRTLKEFVTFEPREYKRALATKAPPDPWRIKTPYREAHPLAISDDAQDEARLFCESHGLDFPSLYENWKQRQFRKHFDTIQRGENPFDNPGKVFFGYIAQVAKNNRG